MAPAGVLKQIVILVIFYRKSQGSKSRSIVTPEAIWEQGPVLAPVAVLQPEAKFIFVVLETSVGVTFGEVGAVGGQQQ